MLKHHGELEAQLVADPGDEGVWLVFEDWLMTVRDPRAAIIEAERAHDPVEAAKFRGRLAGALYGKQAAKHVSAETSRAGMLLACTFQPKRKGEILGAELAGSVGAQTLAKLELEVWSDAAVAAFAPLPALAELTLTAAVITDAAVLAGFVRLRRLRASVSPLLRAHPCLARLEAVDLDFGGADLGDAPEFAGAKEVRLHHPLRGAKGAVAARFPAVEQLEIALRSDATGSIDALLAPALPCGLRRLRVGHRRRHAVSAAERAGTPFAQLDELAVPYDWYQRHLKR